MAGEAMDAGKTIEELEKLGKTAEEVNAVRNDLSEATSAIEEASEAGEKGITEGSKAQKALDKGGRSIMKLAGVAESDMNNAEEVISKAEEIESKASLLGKTLKSVGELCLKNPGSCIGIPTLLCYMVTKGIPDPAAAAAEMAGEMVKAFFYSLFGQRVTYIIWGLAGLAGLIILGFIIYTFFLKKGGNGGGNRSQGINLKNMR